MVAFVAICVLLGLYVAMTVYLFAVMTIQGRFKILLAALVSIGTAIAFYVVMEVWFQVPLLKGPVEAMLGIY